MFHVPPFAGADSRVGFQNELQVVRIYTAECMGIHYGKFTAKRAFLHSLLDVVLWASISLLASYYDSVPTTFGLWIPSFVSTLCQSHRGAPNASGIRSTVYLCPLMYMQGTPGIFRIRPRSSLSQVATMKHRHCWTMCVKQSSAYPFLAQLHGTRSNRGSLASRRAILYFPPSFSNSAITQSVTHGMHLASKQSIMLRTISSFFLRFRWHDDFKKSKISRAESLYVASHGARSFLNRSTRRNSPNTEIDKIRIHQYMVRRTKLFIVLKKQRCIGLFNLSRFLLFLFLGCLFGLGFFQILSDASVLVGDHLFCHGKLSSLLCLPHDWKTLGS